MWVATGIFLKQDFDAKRHDSELFLYKAMHQFPHASEIRYGPPLEAITRIRKKEKELCVYVCVYVG